jgi:hypothetical protein
MVVIQFQWLNRVPETMKPYDKMNLDGQENDFTAIVEEERYTANGSIVLEQLGVTTIFM